MMKELHPTISIALRIPGSWCHAEEMLERIPQGYQITDDRLVLRVKRAGVLPVKEQYHGGGRVDTAVAIDWSAGVILAKLKQLGIDANTLVKLS